MRRDHRISRSAADVLAEERRVWERDLLPVGRGTLRPVREQRPRARRGLLAGAITRERSTGAAVGAAIAVAVEAAIAAGDRADG